MCGTPRPDGANFCMTCGSRLPEQERLCPTCGQVWPQEESGAATELTSTAPAAAAAAGVAAAPAMPAAVPAFVAVRGAYTSPHGLLYFDGTGWYRARTLPGDVYLPDPAQPLPGFQPETAQLTLLMSEAGGAASDSALPRGPQVGPDYDPDRDCGNCGFEKDRGADQCPHCGSANTGPVFRPGG
jgi:RNA polymerase subunit RPABC4/transcription elongation factor Spt4